MKVRLPNSLKKGRRNSSHRLCTNNVNEALKEIEAKGIRLIDAESRPGAEGLNIAFSASKIHRRSTYRIM